MTVGYRQRKAGLAPDYICAGPREVDRIEKGYCQRISGYSLDLAVGAMLVETVTPLALEVALSVQQEMQSRWDEADRLRRLQVDRARYESELARRRFLRVDPDNRLVAASLEAEWNVKLRALAEADPLIGEYSQGLIIPLPKSPFRCWRPVLLGQSVKRLWIPHRAPDAIQSAWD